MRTAPTARDRGFRLRRATLADVDLLIAHRVAMFRSMGGRAPRVIAAHAPIYLEWLVPRIASAEVVAWIAEGPDRSAWGSATLWFAPGRPRPGSATLRTPYLLSVFTEPTARGQGVATTIVREAAALSRRLGYKRLELHASEMGKSVYAKLGFEPTTEMRLILDPAERRRDRERRARQAALAAAQRATTPARRAPAGS